MATGLVTAGYRASDQHGDGSSDSRDRSTTPAEEARPTNGCHDTDEINMEKVYKKTLKKILPSIVRDI